MGDRAAGLLRSISPALQQCVLSRGNLWNAQNPSSALMVRIRDVEKLESPTTDEKARLVSQVKAWQRQSQSHKESWWRFCTLHGSNHFDPNRHDESVLMEFVQAATAGHIELLEPTGEFSSPGYGGTKRKWDDGWGGKGGGASQPDMMSMMTMVMQAMGKGGGGDAKKG